VSYPDGLALQAELWEARVSGKLGDTLLLLEHPDVITLGRGTRPGSLHFDEASLRARGYDVHHVARGGDVTWHGPGQLVGYPIVDLSTLGRDVHVYLRRLEDILIDVLAGFSLAARRRDGYTGVWLDDVRKIASIGIGLRRWVTQHGFALNVCCDLARFDAIVPCGLEEVRMTSVSEALGRRVSVDVVAEQVAAAFAKAFA
jgi:lipoate-protein ligase B